MKTIAIQEKVKTVSVFFPRIIRAEDCADQKPMICGGEK